MAWWYEPSYKVLIKFLGLEL